MKFTAKFLRKSAKQRELLVKLGLDTLSPEQALDEIRVALEHLRPRYAYVIRAVYGIDRESMTIADLAWAFELTTSRMYMLRNEAVAELSKWIKVQ